MSRRNNHDHPDYSVHLMVIGVLALIITLVLMP
jgi:hypothetical protein